IEPVWIYPTGYNAADPFEDGWYDPQSWNVMGRSVHKTRLLTFIGRPVPDLLKPAYSFGGISLSQMAYPYVENWLKTRQGVNDIITSFTQFVLKTGMDAVLSGGSADSMLARAAMFNNTRSNRGLLMIDKEAEEFENVSSPLSGLDALQAQSQEHMASVSHIPTVKLLGVQPAGLNASSEGELRSFYDWTHSFQEDLYRQNLHALLGLVMLSLWGETDDGIDFEFEPLWSLDEKGLAEVEKTKAETRL
ncbi:phage portal protein, partial [Salmonella enterica subsp. enterica serovar Paratyphi A]